MSTRGPNHTKEWVLFGVVLAALLFVAPLTLSDFRLNLLGKFLALAVLALGLDLAWGYTGILSLGQGVFFGIGGYCMAMYLKLSVGTAGTYQVELPDFMVWNGLTALPWFWKPMYHFWVAMLCAILVPAVFATIFGLLTFRSRVQGVYFAIITQALALVASLLLIGQQPYTGGTNGITDFKDLLGFPLGDNKTQRGLYIATVLCLAVSYVFCRWLIRSKFGRVLAAIRDAENRARFLAYDTVMYKVFVFAVSGALAGLAGALFVPQVGIISPSNIGVVPSIEMAIWVAVGGRGTLSGAVLGAVLVNGAKSAFSESFPEFWLYFLGLLFVGVVLFFPDGAIGVFRKAGGVFRRSVRSAPEVQADAPPEAKPAEPISGAKFAPSVSGHEAVHPLPGVSPAAPLSGSFDERLHP
ncbi:MAG TPA: urea ABC transporter permease subunit UrtC [Bryobacterales bacterium]|nr:urea ABC transporter permease subunit UrtC [Bryobacterales bacterium]